MVHRRNQRPQGSSVSKSEALICKLSISLRTFLCLTFALGLAADEPIMNMMPRWKGGWGIQTTLEHRYESDLLLGDQVIHDGFREDVNILHLEGVYTWERAIRLTAKLPYVLYAQRELPDGSGNKITQRDQGLGDLTLALPLKKYFNLDGRSGSWTFKPTLRVPLSGEDEYEVYYGEWGSGLGLSYEFETYRMFFFLGTSGWFHHEDKPFESHSSLDLGYKFEARGTNAAILWESDFHYKDDDSETLLAGPALYWNINDLNHLRLEWKHDFHDRKGVIDHGNGDAFKLSLGWVY